MKSFVVISCGLLALANFSLAAPQYGGGGGRPRPQPHRNCKTINDVKYVEQFDNVCNTVYDYQLCLPTYQQKCDQKRRQKCNDNYRTIYDTEYENICDDVWANECEKIWKDDGYGGKVWEEDKTSCKDVKRTECRDEERKVPRQEKYQTCDWENYQDCYQVPGKHNCNIVVKNQCYNRSKSVQDATCKEVPRKVCKQVHKEVPTQITREVCEGDADWEAVRDGTYSVGNVRNQVGTKDVTPTTSVRQGDVDDAIKGLGGDHEEDAEIVPKSSDETDNDAIVFG